MGELGKWAKKGKKFLTCQDNETIQGKFTGAKIIPSNFDPTKETIAYTIDEKQFNCSNKGLASQMDLVPLGSVVHITRKGTGVKTSYSVEVVG